MGLNTRRLGRFSKGWEDGISGVFSAEHTVYRFKCKVYAKLLHPRPSFGLLLLPTLSISLPDAHPTLTVPPGYPLLTLPSASALNPALVPPHAGCCNCCLNRFSRTENSTAGPHQVVEQTVDHLPTHGPLPALPRPTLSLPSAYPQPTLSLPSAYPQPTLSLPSAYSRSSN